jgi:hypothetical protein
MEVKGAQLVVNITSDETDDYFWQYPVLKRLDMRGV